MPSIDCSLSVTPETKDVDSFMKTVAGLTLILVYNGLRIYLRRFRSKISGFMEDKQ